MLTRISAILSARGDTEHVMSANRTVFCLAMALFCAFSSSVPWFVAPILVLVGVPVAALLFCHLLVHPGAHPLRRAMALVADMASISLVMHYGDEATSCFYPLFLWTIFGNGIRFGLRDLAIATALGFVGFSAVVLTTPFWLSNPSLSIGLVAGTLIVPGYSSHLIRNLTAAREAAVQASHAKTRFLANISHDLRTPLQALLGTSELLSATVLTPSQDSMVDTCLSAGRSLLHMVDGLLRFTQLQEAPTTPELSTFDPVDMLQHVIRVSAPLCHRKGLTLSANFSPLLPPTLTSDQNRLEEVLLNLVSNAAKFTETGGVLVTVSPSGPGVLRFEVADTGIGVAAAARQHIFGRFVQADDSVRLRFGGSGMGLAICRELISGLDGHIGLAPGDGTGSTFWVEVPGAAAGDRSHDRPASHAVTLLLSAGPAQELFAATVVRQGRPRANAAGPCPASVTIVTDASGSHSGPDDLRRTRPPGQRQAIILVGGASGGSRARDARWSADIVLEPSCSPEEVHAALAVCDAVCRPRSATPGRVMTAAPMQEARVLVVDDNKANRLIFSRILSTGQYETVTADDGEKALIALEQGRFDLVIMDVNMPRIDGLEATRLQRISELGRPRIPIVGLTADGSEETRRDCMAAGMDACLIKPVMPQQLLDIVQQLLRPTPSAGTPGLKLSWQEKTAQPVVDWVTLQCLDDIGGPDFRAEILSEFEQDVLISLGNLQTAVDRHDVSEVRRLGHALASVASNVGATVVVQHGRGLETCSEAMVHDAHHGLVDVVHDAVHQFLLEARAGSPDGNDEIGRNRA